MRTVQLTTRTYTIAKAQYENDRTTQVDHWKEHVGDSSIINIDTNWEEYTELKMMTEKEQLSGKTVFDSKRLFQKQDLKGTHYVTIG